MKYFIVVNIGCLECGVSSNLVGVFDSEEKAVKVAKKCQKKYDWRGGGDNAFKVYELHELNKLDPEYQIKGFDNWEGDPQKDYDIY